MTEPSLDQVLREALRQYEKLVRPCVAAKQSRSERNRHVSAQVTKMVAEKRKEWSTIASLNDLTLAVCSIWMTMMKVVSRATFLSLRLKVVTVNLPLHLLNPRKTQNKRSNIRIFLPEKMDLVVSLQHSASSVEERKEHSRTLLLPMRGPVCVCVCVICCTYRNGVTPDTLTTYSLLQVLLPEFFQVSRRQNVVGSCNNMSRVDTWIAQLPNLTDKEFLSVHQAVVKENEIREDKKIFSTFRRKSLPADLRDDLSIIGG